MVAICSAQPLVIKTAMQIARDRSQPLLLEVTANQVNQFGGYTGMTPLQFSTFARQMASQVGLKADQMIIGADHLGPWVWKEQTAHTAMTNAEELLRQCIHAGFQKIHLDTTYGCADDGSSHLPIELNAQRSVQLCRIAESMTYQKGPLYVIGSDVPQPGGGLLSDSASMVTGVDRMLMELKIFKAAFRQLGLGTAWSRVIAMVVQPGVDFGDTAVSPYQPDQAVQLSAAYVQLPDHMTFEIHATDYQSPHALQQMVRDHFMLLKVGPCITFAMRRALYALAGVESGLPNIDEPSNLQQVMEQLMLAHPDHWQCHYQGTAEQLRHLRHNSLRDRIRYYWLMPEARQAVERLMKNLQRSLPASLLNQYLPEHVDEIGDQGLWNDPVGIVQLVIRHALTPYFEACNPR